MFVVLERVFFVIFKGECSFKRKKDKEKRIFDIVIVRVKFVYGLFLIFIEVEEEIGFFYLNRLFFVKFRFFRFFFVYVFEVFVWKLLMCW